MPYLTPDQAAAYIPGATKGYLAQLRFTGRGPRFLKPSPKKVLYIESDIIEWLESTAQISTAA